MVDSQVSSDTEAMSTTKEERRYWFFIGFHASKKWKNDTYTNNYSGKKAGSSDATTTVMRPSPARNDILADKMRDDLIGEIFKVNRCTIFT